MKNDRVNFFIIGAPKCGTTALVEYLKEHKDIFISYPKEPHYFATDLENYRFVKTEEEYVSLFNDVNTESAIGEGSVFYLYSKEAIKNIKEYNPDAKLIIMLRNPIEMVPSLHAQLIYSADEDILDFDEAWSATELRKKGKSILEYTRDVKILYYTEIAKYAEQLLNVKKYFPDEQIKVILFDDFKHDTKKTYEDVLDFLNVSQNGKIDFPRINENTKPKSAFLNRYIKRNALPIVQIYLKIKNIMGIKGGLGLLGKVHDLNTMKVKRKDLSEEMKLEIINNYRSDILKLSSLLNKDLSDWLT